MVEAAEASPSALQLDVRIDKFWAWFQPGFWQITLNGDIATQLSFEGHAQPYVVSISAQDKRQAAHDRAWVEILDMALAQYRAAVEAQAGGFPKATSDWTAGSGVPLEGDDTAKPIQRQPADFAGCSDQPSRQ